MTGARDGKAARETFETTTPARNNHEDNHPRNIPTQQPARGKFPPIIALAKFSDAA